MTPAALRITVFMFGVSVSTPSARAQSPQLGLRMDSRSAMQWSGDTLLVKGDARSFTRLPVSRIDDVWPGPHAGNFGIVSPEGVAMLLGTTTVPAGVVIERGELLRSSRPDAIYAAVSGRGGARQRIVEVRRGRWARELVTFDQRVADFDTDVAGHVVALLTDGRVVLIWGATARSEIPASSLKKATGAREARRVFLDAPGGELAVFAGDAIARLEINKGTWTIEPFDTEREALVRHVVTRRMRIEERWRVR